MKHVIRTISPSWTISLIVVLGFFLLVLEAAAQSNKRDRSDYDRQETVERSSRSRGRSVERGNTEQRTSSRGRREAAERSTAKQRRDRRGRGHGSPQRTRSKRRDSRSGRGQVRRAPERTSGRAGRGRDVTQRRRYSSSTHNRPKYKRPHRRSGTTVYVHPGIHIDIDWPWVRRHRHGWRPRYKYRQVVYVEVGWGRRHHRRSQLDIRTYYRHRIRHASRGRAEIDIYLDRIEIYDDGYFVGEVHHIPGRLGRIRATVYRDGHTRFDRDVFLVGDPRVGFELISTRHYNRFVLDAYERAHGYQVGVLDLRRGRVERVRYSRLFDPYNFDGYVPMSLLPDDAGWLCDYGRDSFSARYYGEDYYYGGYDDDAYYDRPERLRPSGQVNIQPLRREGTRQFSTRQGAEIQLQRTTEILRVE